MWRCALPPYSSCSQRARYSAHPIQSDAPTPAVILPPRVTTVMFWPARNVCVCVCAHQAMLDCSMGSGCMHGPLDAGDTWACPGAAHDTTLWGVGCVQRPSQNKYHSIPSPSLRARVHTHTHTHTHTVTHSQSVTHTHAHAHTQTSSQPVHGRPQPLMRPQVCHAPFPPPA